MGLVLVAVLAERLGMVVGQLLVVGLGVVVGTVGQLVLVVGQRMVVALNVALARSMARRPGLRVALARGMVD